MIVEVPGVGNVEFPDDMTPQAIEQAIQSVGGFSQGGVSVDQQALSEFGPKLEGAIAGTANTLSFGMADEAEGVIGAAGALMPGGQTPQDAYVQNRDRVRAEHSKRQQAEPAAYMGGEVLGATIPALASVPLAVGKSIWGNMARGSVIGAGEGGLQGFGRGEGAEDSGRKAVADAMLGALVGGGVPAATGGAKEIARILVDPVGGALSVGNKSRANRALVETVNKSGQSLDNIGQKVTRAADLGQPEFRTMDALGITGQRRASGLTRQGGDAADEIAEFLKSRQLDQGERVGNFVEDAFGFRAQGSGNTLPIDPLNPIPETSSQVLSGHQVSAKQTGQALEKARTDTADIAYDAARGDSSPVDIRDALGIIDSRIGGMQGVDIAGDSIDAKLGQFRRRLAADKTPDGVDSIELSDFDRVLGVKQDVQDARGAALRAGRNNEARELQKLEKALDTALEGSSDSYRAANDGFREASRVIDAVPEGVQMASRGRAADNVPRFQSMSPDQQAAARIGYGDRVLAALENNKAPTANKAKPLQSPKATAESDAIALEPQVFRERLDNETRMWDTQNRALGGSRTADNLADIGSTGQLAADASGVAGSLATGNPAGAISNLTRMVGPKLKGENEATRQLLVQALMSRNPQAALGPAVETHGRAMVRQKMLEALLRNGAREMRATE